MIYFVKVERLFYVCILESNGGVRSNTVRKIINDRGQILALLSLNNKSITEGFDIRRR